MKKHFPGSLASAVAGAAVAATIMLIMAIGGTLARGATLYGNIQDVGLAAQVTNITFKPLSTPVASGSTIFISKPKVITTAADGGFTNVFTTGDYQVTLGGIAKDSFVVAVPNSTNGYNWTALITNALTYTYTSAPTYVARSTLGTRGGILVYDGTNVVELPPGANGELVQADSTSATGLKYAAAASLGTVTSVGLTSGTGGLVITGTTPITSAGTWGITLDPATWLTVANAGLSNWLNAAQVAAQIASSNLVRGVAVAGTGITGATNDGIVTITGTGGGGNDFNTTQFETNGSSQVQLKSGLPVTNLTASGTTTASGFTLEAGEIQNADNGWFWSDEGLNFRLSDLASSATYMDFYRTNGAIHAPIVTNDQLTVTATTTMSNATVRGTATMSNDVIFPGTGTFRQKRVGDGSGSALVHRWEQGGLNGGYEFWDAPYSASNKVMSLDVTAGSQTYLTLYRQGGWVDSSNYERFRFWQDANGAYIGTDLSGSGLSNSCPLFLRTMGTNMLKLFGTPPDVAGAAGFYHPTKNTPAFVVYGLGTDADGVFIATSGSTSAQPRYNSIQIGPQTGGAGNAVSIGRCAATAVTGTDIVAIGGNNGNISPLNLTSYNGTSGKDGAYSTAVGSGALYSFNGKTNTGYGYLAGGNTTAYKKVMGYYCLFLGNNTGLPWLEDQPSTNKIFTNAIAIGSYAISSNNTVVIGSTTNPITQAAIGGSHSLMLWHGLNTASNAAVNVGTNLYRITSGDDLAGTNATLQVDVLAKTLKIQGTAAKSITNTWYSHDATGATMVTNIQVYTQGILTSWKQNGTEL